MKAVALASAIALTGCIFYDPNVGRIVGAPPDGQQSGTASEFGCSDVDSNPDVNVSLANDIRPLMLRSPGGCTPCHLGRITSGLDLSSYASMRRGGFNSGANVIVPGKPCESIIAGKLSPTPPFGSRMPFNGPPYFSATELQLVRDWIAEGALDN